MAVKIKKHRKLNHYYTLYIMMIPAMLYLLINNYLPMIGVAIAFKQVNFRIGIIQSPWVGFANFEFLFRTQDAWIITRNTLGYNATFIILGTVMAIVVAILLNEVSSKKMKSLYQGVFLLPFLISIVVVSYLVFGFLATETGYINNLLRSLGLEHVRWYTSSRYWPFILVLVNFWRSFGYFSIIYFATLVGIDRTYYEAAVVDGAGKWKQITKITLPLLKPTIITLVLLAIGRIFYTDFGLFYQVPLNSGPLLPVTNTIDTYVYRGLMHLGSIGMASAAGFYQAVVGFVLVLLANLIVRRLSKENALF